MRISETDFFLVSQVKIKNSHEAFEKIVLKYQSQIRRLFLNLTSRNKSLSDDLAQETFIKVYLNLKSFRADSKFSTWIYRVAYNVFLDYKKKNKRIDEYNLPDNDINYSNSQNIQFDNDLSHILGILNNDEKELIVLSYIEEFTHKEISSITNLPLGTVKTIIKRGREKLANHLKKSHEYTR
jgi:RNA polymerase sigma-70 factor (ECF subfamily)